MKLSTTSLVLSTSILGTGSVDGFAFINSRQCSWRKSQPLQMGLFDGVKEAFSAPALERSSLDSERETPIDRWMGWNVDKDEEQAAAPVASKVPSNFIDSMDASNYVSVEIAKPMGIVFEENDNDLGGMFLLSMKEGGHASENGNLKPGDQCVAVGNKQVHGLDFDSALGVIVDSEEDVVKLVFFRGSADMLYGPTGASKEWLDEFLSSD